MFQVRCLHPGWKILSYAADLHVYIVNPGVGFHRSGCCAGLSTVKLDGQVGVKQSYPSKSARPGQLSQTFQDNLGYTQNIVSVNILISWLSGSAGVVGSCKMKIPINTPKIIG
jgi:hypothetical protein